MTIALFALILALLALEATKHRVLRIGLVLAIAAVAAAQTFGLQTELRRCHSDETQTVAFLLELFESSLPIAVTAAQSYQRAREQATYENPFRFGLYPHIVQAQSAR